MPLNIKSSHDEKKEIRKKNIGMVWDEIRKFSKNFSKLVFWENFAFSLRLSFSLWSKFSLTFLSFFFNSQVFLFFRFPWIFFKFLEFSFVVLDFPQFSQLITIFTSIFSSILDYAISMIFLEAFWFFLIFSQDFSEFFSDIFQNFS